MSVMISAKQLSKLYHAKTVLHNLNFEVEKGQIVGLLGPNGAGKTTLLKTLLGLAPYQGTINVAGFNPWHDRVKMMQEMCFIADVAILPRWLRVSQAVQFVEGVHPKFSATKAKAYLAKTDIPWGAKVQTLSKGMVAQLHLALVMAIDVPILILDEPTLGLDIIFRKTFYRNLLNDYFNEERTIIVTTHQVEEIEHILTHLMMIDRGELILHDSLEALSQRFCTLLTTADKVEAAAKFQPIDQQKQLTEVQMIFENVPRTELAPYGQVSDTRLSDLFVAKVSGGRA